MCLQLVGESGIVVSKDGAGGINSLVGMTEKFGGMGGIGEGLKNLMGSKPKPQKA